MTDLLPCPICGGKAEHLVFKDRGNHNVVKCTECGCRVSSHLSGCVSVWNNRNIDKNCSPTNE